jgi:transcription elongation factor GreA
MGEKQNIMTYDGLQALEGELQHLKVVRRKEIAEKIKEAREQGDLSENAEYDAAKEEQGHIEARITEIEELLKYAVVVDEEDGEADKVRVGCTVLILDVEFDEEMKFRIVGPMEANSLEGKISIDSPVGKALLGKRAGEEVSVETLDGDVVYRILAIQKN